MTTWDVLRRVAEERFVLLRGPRSRSAASPHAGRPLPGADEAGGVGLARKCEVPIGIEPTGHDNGGIGDDHHVERPISSVGSSSAHGAGPLEEEGAPPPRHRRTRRDE